MKEEILEKLNRIGNVHIPTWSIHNVKEITIWLKSLNYEYTIKEELKNGGFTIIVFNELMDQRKRKINKIKNKS